MNYKVTIQNPFENVALTNQQSRVITWNKRIKKHFHANKHDKAETHRLQTSDII